MKQKGYKFNEKVSEESELCETSETRLIAEKCERKCQREERSSSQVTSGTIRSTEISARDNAESWGFLPCWVACPF